MGANEKGSVLLVSTLVLYLIIAISVTFFMVNINEVNYSRQFYYSTQAFWLAEAGINTFMANPTMLEGQLSAEVDYANGRATLTEDDSHPMFRYINSVGEMGGQRRQIRVAYPANVPEVFHNSISTNGNVEVDGRTTMAVVNGQTRISGTIHAALANSSVIFDDAQQDVDPSLTTLNYAGTTDSDPRANFINNNRNLIANYPPNQVLYLNNTSAMTLTPDQVAGKSIVYVEDETGGGNVTINTSGLVGANQNLTIIATGTVTYNQNGSQAPDSQLNIIAYGGYNETVNASSTYNGIIYTYGTATFNQIKADSITTGNVIANGGITLGDVWATKIFNYGNMTATGQYPPGFETMIGGSTSGVAAHPTSWKEIPL